MENTMSISNTELRDSPKTNNQLKCWIKKSYLAEKIGLPDAIPALMFDHDMMLGDALRYLGL
jgi:hypothetical protein